MDLDLHRITVARVADARYYIDKFLRVLLNDGYMSMGSFYEEVDEHKIWNTWNNFWYELPDDPAIRTGPFFEICELCENEPEVK